MTVETLKPFIKAPAESAELKRQNGTKTALVCHSVVLSIFYVGLLGFVIWNSVRVANLQKEVKHLNMLMETMQKRLGFDLFDDLNEFEEAYGQSAHDDKVIPDKSFFDGDQDDYDAELSDVDDNEDDYMDDELYGGSSEEDDLHQTLNETRKTHADDSVYDDLDDLDDWDYKVEKESENSDKSENADRKTRSIASRSGVPIVEEPYPARINKTAEVPSPAEPTMKYDWNEKREQYLERKHKKYMQMRSRPASIVQAEGRGETNSKENNHLAQQNSAPSQRSWSDPRITPTHSTIQSRPNRVMHTSEDKSQAYRQDKATSYPGQVVLTGTRRRAVRPIHKSLEPRGRQRSVAAHFVGDTSRYTPGHHRRYEGNGRLRHSGGVYVDWTVDSTMGTSNQLYRLENGVVTIHENGIYLIYAQIFYHDVHDTNGFRVEKNGEPFLLCTVMAHSSERVTKSNTCFTSGVAVLRPTDTIRITDLAYDRHVILDPVRSFFGLVKLGVAPPAHHGPDHDEKARRLDTLKRSPKI